MRRRIRFQFPLLALGLLALLAALWGGLLNAVTMLLFLALTLRAARSAFKTHQAAQPSGRVGEPER
jgi:hypothetical protein